ncbi:hypothetical protein [Nocardia sp. BMG51109]|uniref:hypothetical protein n=1 Tax=Nocardia sp. BMG51109 TaxID=1056816 RepID=UPI00350F03E4
MTTTAAREIRVLPEREWRARAAAHRARADDLIRPYLEHRAAGTRHPVIDFLFTYYGHKPAQLRRWHPGFGIALENAAEYANFRGYHAVSVPGNAAVRVHGDAGQTHAGTTEADARTTGTTEVGARAAGRTAADTRATGMTGAGAGMIGVPETDAAPGSTADRTRESPAATMRDAATASVPACTADPDFLLRRLDTVEYVAKLLRATASRSAQLSCFGLHEWAMVYRSDEVRHRQVPMRLGRAGTDAVVESMSLRCTHFDAFRFFTPDAVPRNAERLTREDQPLREQPGCLHANMDLYKWGYKLAPLIDSELLLDCFELACDARELDMRASPYDLSGYGYTPVPIETPSGRAEYVRCQAQLAERAAPLRRRLLEAAERLVRVAPR